MVHTRRRYLACAATATATLAGCLGSEPGIPETSKITMANSQFDPRNTHVDAGTTVTWTNEDSSAHTVTNASDNWTFDTEVPAGESTTYTFEDDGVYDVYCRFHGGADLSGMSMKVAVGEGTINDPLGGEAGGGGPY